MEPQKKSRHPMAIAFFTIFLDLVGFGIIIPVQAFYAESLGASPVQVTLLGAAYSLMQFLFAPFWGRLSDRYGRRPIVLFSVLISVVGYSIFALSQSYMVLLLARMLAGFGNANIATAQAIIADVTTAENRSKGMGLIGAAFGLGFIFGPAIGGALSHWGVQGPAFAAAGLSLLNLGLAYMLLPETLKPGNLASRHGFLSLKRLQSAMRHVNAKNIFVISLVGTGAFAMMEQVIGLYIEAVWVTDGSLDPAVRIKAAARLTSYFLVAVGITATIVQGGLIGRLTKRFGERAICRSGLALMVVAMVLVPPLVGSQSMPLLLLGGVLLAAAMGLWGPATTGLLSISVDADEQGGVLGINQSLSALGRVLGPLAAGALFQTQITLPFYVGAGFFLVASLVAMSLRLVR